MKEEVKKVFQNQIQSLNDQYLEQAEQILAMKQQGDQNLVELIECLKNIQSFINSIHKFLQPNDHKYVSMLQNFLKNIYQYKDIALIETFSFYFAKLTRNNRMVNEYLIKHSTLTQSEKSMVILSYFIDQHLPENIFSTNMHQYQFTQLESDIKK